MTLTDFYAYIIQHNKKYDYYLIKCQFKLVSSVNNYSPYVTSKLFDNKTMIAWQNFSEKVIDDFEKRYNSHHIEELNIITKLIKWICHMISILDIICMLLSGN